MSTGLYSGASGLALGRGLYRDVSGLWGGASGLVTGFGSAGPTPFQTLDALTAGKTGTGVYDGRAATVEGSTLTVVNLSGDALSFLQATSAQQPTVNPTTGLGFDGVDDSVSVDMLNLVNPQVVMARVRVNPESTSGFIIGAAARYESGNSLSLSGVSVDGVETPTRGDLYTAVSDGAWHTIRFFGSPFQDGAVARAYALGHPRSSFSFLGDAIGVVILLPSEFPTDLEAAEAAAENWLVSITP